MHLYQVTTLSVIFWSGELIALQTFCLEAHARLLVYSSLEAMLSILLRLRGPHAVKLQEVHLSNQFRNRRTYYTVIIFNFLFVIQSVLIERLCKSLRCCRRAVQSYCIQYRYFKSLCRPACNARVVSDFMVCETSNWRSSTEICLWALAWYHSKHNILSNTLFFNSIPWQVP